LRFDRFRWVAFPLGLYLTTRLFLTGLGGAGTIMGTAVGFDHELRPRFAKAQPALAALAHGDVSIYARVVRDGYRAPDDIRIFPVVVGLGKAFAAFGLLVETWLLATSLVAGAAAFLMLYRLFQRIADDGEGARWTLALMGAFPFSFHLSDGSPLSLVVFLSALAAWLALEGRLATASLVAAIAALAHPAGLAVTPLLAWPGSKSDMSRRPVMLRAAAALLPFAVTAGWLGYVDLPVGGLWSDPFKAPAPLTAASLLFVGFLAVGGVLMLVKRAPRGLTASAFLQIGLLVVLGGAPAGRALAASWLVFLPLGQLVARRSALAAPTVAMLATYQGLFFYLFSHYYGPL
jgi:hypothetical protein